VGDRRVEEPRPRVGGAEAEVLAGEHDGTSSADAIVAARVMQRYEERLAAYRAVDFDDLIVLPARLLGSDAECATRGARACATSSSTSTRTPTASSTS
jgi:superfamily I DNA/RNA helicase